MAIKIDWERTLQPGLVLSLCKQILQLDKFDLQVQFPSKKDQSYVCIDMKKGTHMAMNSWIELFKFVDLPFWSTRTVRSPFPAAKELEATNRVYNQPI